MQRARTAAWLGAFALLTACRSDPGADSTASQRPVVEADPARLAQRAAQDFSGQLRAALQQAMQAGGANEAIHVCHDAAPAIAERVMRAHGVRLGRVALPGRQRNPQHAAQGELLRALQAMDAAVRAGGDPAAQVQWQREGLDDGVALRMVRGIPTEALCLTCHGKAVEPALQAKIFENYPSDGATGFALGELRGALWVEVPAARH